MFDLSKDKNLWERVRTSPDYARHRKEIKEKYDWAFAQGPARQLTYTEIVTNDDHGHYFARFFQLYTSAVMALIYPKEEKYMEQLTDIIWTYCGEYAWAPMGHYNSYYGVTPKDYDPYVIDIYGASIGFALAEIKNLLKDRLPKIVVDRLTAEIKTRIINPYLNRNYFWEKHNNNWAAVCAGAVGGTIIYEAPELFPQVKDRLDATMQCYLREYGDDGVCVEGCAYWGFGFGYFVTYAALAKELTNGKVDYFKDKKVKSISEFIQKTFLQRNIMVTFSDCNTTEGYWLGLPHMLRDIYGDSIEKLPNEMGTIIVYQHFPFLLRSIVYFNPEYSAEKMADNVTYLMPNANWLTKRTKNYGFALKGGNNGESHNHCDLGSFIVARNNKQILFDLGSGPYVEGYHTDKRLSFFAPSSASHNVPYFNILKNPEKFERKANQFGEIFEFNGIAQDGKKRDDVKIVYDEKNNIASCEFSNAYGENFIDKAYRQFKLEESKIEMTDEFVLDDDIEITERFTTKIEPKVNGNSVVIDDVCLTPDIAVAPKITVVPCQAHAGSENKEYNVYCIDYTLPQKTKTFKISITM